MRGFGEPLLCGYSKKLGAENLRVFRLAGNIISIPIKVLNLTKDQQNYLKYVEYVKEVRFVDNAIELTLNTPQWVLQMLTEEEQSPSV